MTKSNDRSLLQAFRQTNYRIWADKHWHDVAIGAPCPQALRNWLSIHCAGHCAWIITAHNPQAKAVDALENAARDAALKAWLDTGHHAYVITDSCAQGGDWPCEPGVCVLDMNEGQARALALRFEQAAMVALPIEYSVQLVFIDI